MSQESQKYTTASIPITWKKWYALLKGISEGWIKPCDENDDTLTDVIENLEVEATQSIKGFPTEILGHEDPGQAIDSMKSAARRIREAYSLAKANLGSFPGKIVSKIDSVVQECEVVQKLCDAATPTDIHSLASGYSFKELPPEVFRDLVRINSSAAVESFKLVPISGREMSFHAILVILMLKSHLFSNITSPMNPEIWSKLYSKKIAWNATPERNSWIINYIYEEPMAFGDGLPAEDDSQWLIPSSEDMATWESFIGRPSFNRICEKDELITHGFATYQSDKISILSKVAGIKKDRLAALQKLFKILVEESTYLLRTREALGNRFLSEEDAHHVFMDDQFLQEEQKRLEGLLDNIFQGIDPAGTDILSLLDQLDDFRFYVPLSDKPVVNSAMIRKIIDSCVLDNEMVKSILRDAVTDERILGEIRTVQDVRPEKQVSAESGRDQGGIDSILSELRSGGYVDNDGIINLSGAKFARHLVKSGYVKPGKSWKPWFRNPEWIRFSEEGIISNNEIQELTKELNWKPFDGIFKDKEGKRLSSSNLSKFFSDGDSSYSKRNALFLQIYRRLGHKMLV